MNQYIIPLAHNDPRLFSHVSQAFSLVDLGKRLLDAAKNGDVEEVKNLISNGAPFTTDWLGISPLHFAAMNGHLSSCEALLRAGISRDARTKVDRTPLHLAAQEGHADIVELLLRNGADLSAKDMLRMTALHWAAERGHTPVVQMLMRFGADAHLQNKFEMTPLDIAECKQHDDARDAMLNTQYDLVSSVGRMAATNGDIAGANAYILTEEETLVPAAPPADEVTVTATTVEESSSIRNSETSDTTSKDKKISTHSETESDKSCVSKKIWKTEGLSENTNLDLRAENSDDQITTYSLSQSDNPHPISNAVNKTNLTGDILLPLEEDCGRDVMIVETPDGETLYVHQQPNEDGSNGLVILNGTGEQVNNAALIAQVMDALVTLPENVIGETLNTDNSSANVESELGAPSLQCLDKNSNTIDPKQLFNKTIVNNDVFFQSSANGCQTGSRRLSPTHIIDNEDDDDDIDNDESESLVAHLAAFANQPESQQTTICVEGMGSGASTHDLIMWCLYNGIFIRGYADEPTFVVEFVYQGEAYTLSASYDSQSGSINFYHVEGNQKL
ncbi:hypothetical protein MN116_003134 [Schistosoma mekongi]|uniref:GA-binding protein subunit beta-1 n=1 Tax=Schistosoma mekongi TaxID=38744 RepID=A0AAE2D785_SCHME|nr:hypothetical protein MN116_003134 [Schistosoma mekongi]